MFSYPASYQAGAAQFFQVIWQMKYLLYAQALAVIHVICLDVLMPIMIQLALFLAYVVPLSFSDSCSLSRPAI